jgi:nicotinamidase-related amidase
LFFAPEETDVLYFTDVEDMHVKMGVDDWDIIGQCTSSLMTVTSVVKQGGG